MRTAILVVALLALFALPGPPATAGDDGPDAPVFRLVEELRKKAAGIEVDGRARDWEGFPLAEDRGRNPSVDRSLDIVAVAIAPRESDLLVMIGTRGRPSQEPGAFEVRADFLGLGAADLALRFGASGASRLVLHPEGAKSFTNTLRSVEVAVGEVVEVRIPLLVVASWFPEAQGRSWIEGKRRPWVRVETATLAPGGTAIVDEGPSAASFRLAPTPYALDPPAPRPGTARRAVGLPVEGKWFVRQGPFGLWTHAEQWAYDLSLVDVHLRPSRVPGSADLAHYYAYGRPVRAPEAGRVMAADGSSEDNPALGEPKPVGYGNHLTLRFEDGLRMFLDHLRAGTVRLARGDEFEAGAAVGEVGNSGGSRAPHLHLALHDRPGEFTGLPMAFRSVRVGLNPGPDDPWTRDLASWEIREGYFVEPIPAEDTAESR